MIKHLYPYLSLNIVSIYFGSDMLSIHMHAYLGCCSSIALVACLIFHLSSTLCNYVLSIIVAPMTIHYNFYLLNASIPFKLGSNATKVGVSCSNFSFSYDVIETEVNETVAGFSTPDSHPQSFQGMSSLIVRSVVYI
jgi:hypothetical protein